MDEIARLDRLASEGISGNFAEWLKFNLDAMETPEGRAKLAAFPPPELMQETTGLTDPKHFAQHGVHFLEQLEAACPDHLAGFESILDFGCGVGRVARLFKGFKGRYTGVDVVAKNVDWINEALPYASARVSVPRAPLPFADSEFDCIISVSVFTHMNEDDQKFYLSELQRVSKPGATLLLTTHGQRALSRALNDEFVFNLVSCPMEELQSASSQLQSGSGFKFILQSGHLTTEDYDYGITFIGSDYINRIWSRYFSVVGITSGAIHDFQDIVTLRRR